MTRPASVTLTVIQGPLEPAEFVFDERTTCVIGRSRDCHPKLPGDTDHQTVSRHHCLLDINPPDACVRDFGSRNGTFLNDRKIGQREQGQTPEEGAATAFPEHVLGDGDEIRIGNTVFRVTITAEQGSPSVLRCVKCGREDSAELNARAGDHLCASCRTDPQAAAELLLDLARSSDPALAGITGYTLLRELGRGGMGAVYLARQQVTGREVALKVMLPKVATNQVARGRFLREVVITQELRHPNIATLHDAGFAGGTFYLTTEYCPDGSLDQLVARRGGRLPVDEAVRLFAAALEGLAHAHERSVVHRDLSPSNILLHRAADGALTPKISDFGIAKAFDLAGLSGLTLTGATAGKPSFVPRLQVVDFREATPAMDLWSMAASLYWTLTGLVPRDFPPKQDPWLAVLQSPAVPIRERAPQLPGPLAEVIDHALAEQPGSGFRHAADLRRALLAAV
ncbi:serine/threonine-protein kinase [Kitasatospora sp. NBC_01250]|uniref:protein kinase domain-containing protein n=1 Tax=Kitasatospora sp. NBC_01250 TaxID=2903571 RepID=UPI002E36FE55|nr:protein kinase [Kitasatospora sp. NBC_01250]